MPTDDKGNVFANFAIYILFIWAVAFIPFVILLKVSKPLAIYPFFLAILAGVPGAFIAFIFSMISCIKKPRARGVLAMVLSSLVFIVTLIMLVPMFFH